MQRRRDLEPMRHQAVERDRPHSVAAVVDRARDDGCAMSESCARYRWWLGKQHSFLRSVEQTNEPHESQKRHTARNEMQYLPLAR